MIAIYVDAGHTTSGNPKRGWIITDASGTFTDFVDEGYDGRGALRLKGYSGIAETARIDVKPSVYRDLLKQSR